MLNRSITFSHSNPAGDPVHGWYAGPVAGVFTMFVPVKYEHWANRGECRFPKPAFPVLHRKAAVKADE
jgi:hypothetical protein